MTFDPKNLLTQINERIDQGHPEARTALHAAASIVRDVSGDSRAALEFIAKEEGPPVLDYMLLSVGEPESYRPPVVTGKKTLLIPAFQRHGLALMLNMYDRSGIGLLRTARLWRAFTDANVRGLLATTFALERAQYVNPKFEFPNRRAVEREYTNIQHLLARGELTGPVAAVGIDGNGLRNFNNVYGHFAGDQAIRHIGNSLVACRGQPHLSGVRWGHDSGDEFIGILLGATQDRQEAFRACIAQYCRNLTIFPDPAAQQAGDGLQVPVSVSIGYKHIEPGMPFDIAFADADKSLYREKRRRSTDEPTP